VLLLVATAARFGPVAAVVLLAAVLAVAILVLRYRWVRYKAGGPIAARKRRKYQGAATRRDLRRNLSVCAARRKSEVTAPDLHPFYAPVVIGRAKGRTVAGARSDSYLVIAPPQSLKTGLVSCWAADAPGAGLFYSSRCDQWRHTAAARPEPHWVLNADGDGGIPTTFGWSPVDGCRNPQTAIRRAGDLMNASPRDPGGKDSWHEDRGAKLIRYMLHAAAVAGASMHEVAAWVHDPRSGEPQSILASPYAFPGWDARLAALLECDGDAYGGLTASASAALGWMDDPVMAAAASTGDSGIDLREFIRQASGSIWMIGADRPGGSLAPYFAAFGSEAFETARSVAEEQGGRLQVPFTIVADEAAVICPLPFHKMTAVSAGYNITVIAAVQADSQLTARWGEHDADTMRTNFTVKVIGPGFTNPRELDALSAMCGDRDTWYHVRHDGGSKTRQPDRERAFPPERIRLLRDWHALVVHRNTRPAEVTVTPVWARPGYQPAQPAPVRLPEQPAIEASRRFIAAPAAPPAIEEDPSWQPVISA
jgi:type IV secretion system protein VirD4